MDNQPSLFSRFKELIKTPHFWVIVAMIAILVIVLGGYYGGWFRKSRSSPLLTDADLKKGEIKLDLKHKEEEEEESSTVSRYDQSAINPRVSMGISFSVSRNDVPSLSKVGKLRMKIAYVGSEGDINELSSHPGAEVTVTTDDPVVISTSMEYGTHFDDDIDLRRINIKLFYSESSRPDFFKDWGSPIPIDTQGKLENALANIQGSETVELVIPVVLESNENLTLTSELNIQDLKVKFVSNSGKVFYAEIKHIPDYNGRSDRYLLKNIKYNPTITPLGVITTHQRTINGETGIPVVFVDAKHVENAVDTGVTSLLLRNGMHFVSTNYQYFKIDEGIFDSYVHTFHLNNRYTTDINTITYRYYPVSEEEFANPTDWSADEPTTPTSLDLTYAKFSDLDEQTFYGQLTPVGDPANNQYTLSNIKDDFVGYDQGLNPNRTYNIQIIKASRDELPGIPASIDITNAVFLANPGIPGEFWGTDGGVFDYSSTSTDIRDYEYPYFIYRIKQVSQDEFMNPLDTGVSINSAGPVYSAAPAAP